MPSDLIRRVVSDYGEPFATAEFVPFRSPGLSGARLWRANIGDGRYVLRRWPDGQMSAERLAWIHRLLRRAFDIGCRIVPVPLANDRGTTFVSADGTFWQLEPWMPGEADLEDPPRLEKVAAAVTALAEFHDAARRATAHEVSGRDLPARGQLKGGQSTGRSPALLQRAELLDEMLTDGIERVENASAFVAPPDAWTGIAVKARRWLATLPSRAAALRVELAGVLDVARPLQPVVRDATRDHVLFTAGKVTGFVDFGAMAVDHVTVDLARLAGSYGGDPDIFEQIHRTYDGAKHAPGLTDFDRRLMVLLDRSGTLVAAYRWLGWIFVEERDFADPPAVARRIGMLMARSDAP